MSIKEKRGEGVCAAEPASVPQFVSGCYGSEVSLFHNHVLSLFHSATLTTKFFFFFQKYSLQNRSRLTNISSAYCLRWLFLSLNLPLVFFLSLSHTLTHTYSLLLSLSLSFFLSEMKVFFI